MESNNALPKYIKYVPAQKEAQAKIIRVVEVQKDPMEPARFKINQKIPAAPPSPPVPVLHSPPRKITAEEQKKWKIPPCVSSWKNPRGYTVPLDKRCAFNGRTANLPQPINPKFAQLSEALFIANRQHREALEERMKAEKLMAQKEKEKNEEKLRLLAQQARQERATVQRGLHHHRGDDSEDEYSNAEEERERRRIREDRHRERVRNVNIKAGAPNKRTKFDRARERDISEQIALGMPKPSTYGDDVHDQRLYNQTQGLDQGFGDDEDYTVYDKDWKSKQSFSVNYRPSESLLKDLSESNDEDRPEKTHKIAEETDLLAPIQFEKDDVEDPFNVESFLRHAKYNANKMQESTSTPSSSHHHRSSKRR